LEEEELDAKRGSTDRPPPAAPPQIASATISTAPHGHSAWPTRSTG